MAEMLLSSGHISTCHNINYGDNVGTCFLHSDENGTVFITAAHVIRNIHSGDNILFKRPADWISGTVSAFQFDDEGYDIAAFTIENSKIDIEYVEGRSLAMLPGAELKFLGFPHGLENNYPSGNGFCTPLVRTAFFSGICSIAGRQLHILDGINNPGYSGGPIYWAQSDGTPTLFGVISGYRHERGEATQVFKRLPNGEEQQVLEYFLRPNSGMIYAVGVSRIVRLMSSFLNRM
jgi:hypothetical protein